MTRRYDFQDVLDRFASSQSQRFRELSDAIARRVLELLGGGTVPNDPPGAPSGLTASTDQEFRVVLDWSPVAGATGYNVYRAPIGDTNFAQIGVASTSDYIDVGLPAETSYRYYVTAYNSSGESGPSSTEVGTTADGAAPPLPDVPANFQVLDSVDTVTLGWDAFTGGTVLCRIERSSNQTDWTVVANTGSVTFNDANVTVGATLYYRAYGVSATGVSSVSTPTLTVVVSDGDTTAPPVPVITNTTTANKAIFVEWESVVASDLAGYEIGYGTSSGVYTNTTPLLTGSSAFVTGLTNATQYYFAIRSVDSSLNQNKSAWSNEKFNIPIDQAFPITPEGPGAPTDLVFSSPERNQVRVNFTAGATESPRRHRLYARVKPGGLINGAPPTTAWTQIDQEPHPATVLGKDATIFVGSNSFEQSPVVWQFYVTAVDTYNQESSPSEIVEGLLDGAAWNQGPGSGPIAGGNFNGDQLTPEHRVPGYTFDYVIDVSDPASYTGDAMERAAAIFNNRRGLAPTNPDYLQLSTTDKASIAILLPNETVNRRLEINTGATGNADIEVAEFDFGGDPGFESLVDLHFVAPWDDANATVVDAKAAMRDDPLNFTLGYKRTFKNADNTSKFGDGQGANIKIGDSTRRDAKVDLWFWNWDIEVSGASGVLVGSNADTGSDFKSHDFWVGFGLCRFHQDNVLPNNNRIGSHAIDARYAKIELGGTYIDMPWQDGSAVRCLSPLRGSFGISDVRVRRSGGSAFEFYTRGSRDANLPAGTDAGTLLIQGVRHWDEKPGLVGGVGRATPQGAPFFNFGGIEQAVVFSDCEIVEEIPTNFREPAQWPPPDPYDWRIYAAAVNLTNPAIRFASVVGERQTAAGYKRGPVTIQNSLFYSRNPLAPVLDMEDGESFTLNNVGIFTGESADVYGYDSGAAILLGTTNTTVPFGDGSPYKPHGTPHALGAVTATGLNAQSHRDELTGTYGISLSNILAGDAQVYIGTYEVTHFAVTDDFSFSNYTAPTVPYQMPVDLQPNFTEGGAVVNAREVAEQGNTTTFNKNLRMPVLQAFRAPRVSGELPFVRHWGMGYPDFSGDPDPQFNNILQWPDGNGNFLTYHATQNGSQTGMPPEFGGSGSFEPLFDPAYITHPDDGKTLLIKDVDCFRPANDGRDPFHFSSGESWAAPNPDGEAIHTEHRRPVGGKVIMENVKIDLENIDEEGSQPKWGLRGYNLPNFEVVECDFLRNANEHAIYINPFEDFIVRRSTFFEIASQAIQLTSRASGEGGESEINNGPIERSTYTLLEDCHFIDCTAAHAGTGGTRPSYTATLSNRGTCAYPGKIEVKDCTFVCDVEDAGIGVEGYGSGVKPGARSMGQMVTGFEKGLTGFTNPADSTRANGVAQVHSEIILSNNLFHRMNPGRNSVSLKSAECITIENCAWISDYNGQGVAGSGQVYYRPLTIDVDVNLIRERQAIRSRYLLVRNNWAPPETVGSPVAYHGENRPTNVDPSQGIAYFDLHCPGEEIVYDLWTTDDIGFGPGVLYRGAIRPGFSLTPTL